VNAAHKIRALVVDDEPVARERITSLLGRHEDIEVVGECVNGPEAVVAITQTTPDLVFLDVQMPEMSGFDVVRALEPPTVPAIVFVTAYDEYAIRAFEVHALDYLLKPFSTARFDAALTHVRAQLTRPPDDELARRLRALAPESGMPRRPDRILVRSSGRVHFIRTDEIDWCEAAGNYIRLHVGEQAHLLRETMNALEASLDPHRFARIHRSTIVNLDRIQEMRSSANGESILLLRTGETLTLSRGYRESFQGRFGKNN